MEQNSTHKGGQEAERGLHMMGVFSLFSVILALGIQSQSTNFSISEYS